MDISMKRVFDATYANSVMRHPSVMCGAMVTEDADLSEFVSNLNNVVLVYDGGAFAVENKGSGVYDVHTLALPEGRGKKLRENISKALRYMFVETDCERLITKAFKDNSSSVALSDAFFNRRGESKEFIYYEMPYSKWVESSAEAKCTGESFHGSIEANHDDDITHDHHAGGAILILQTGNYEKATRLYNEWAVMSGYEPIALLRINPLIASMGKDLFIYHNQTLEQILCQ